MTSAPVTLRKEYLSMEKYIPQDEAQDNELVADVQQFAEIFERLSPDEKADVIELLRQLNAID